MTNHKIWLLKRRNCATVWIWCVKYAEHNASRILECKEGQGQGQQMLMSPPRKGRVTPDGKDLRRKNCKNKRLSVSITSLKAEILTRRKSVFSFLVELYPVFQVINVFKIYFCFLWCLETHWKLRLDIANWKIMLGKTGRCSNIRLLLGLTANDLVCIHSNIPQ